MGVKRAHNLSSKAGGHQPTSLTFWRCASCIDRRQAFPPLFVDPKRAHCSTVPLQPYHVVELYNLPGLLDARGQGLVSQFCLTFWCCDVLIMAGFRNQTLPLQPTLFTPSETEMSLPTILVFKVS